MGNQNLNHLNQNQVSNMEKKKPCKTCKKKEIEEPLIDPFDNLDEFFVETQDQLLDKELRIWKQEQIDNIPTMEEIITVYKLMSSNSGVKVQDQPRVNNVYKSLFKEDLPFGCGQCGEKHYRKFKYYIENILKLEL